MRMAFALSALLSITGANAALASNLITNESFGSTTVKGKERFEGNVDGSSGGGNLTYIAAPGTADDGEGEMSLYGPFPRTSPDGGKFVIADGDEPYRDTIWQTIAGLTIGAVYELNFFQAAGQWAGRPMRLTRPKAGGYRSVKRPSSRTRTTCLSRVSERGSSRR